MLTLAVSSNLRCELHWNVLVACFQWRQTCVSSASFQMKSRLSAPLHEKLTRVEKLQSVCVTWSRTRRYFSCTVLFSFTVTWLFFVVVFCPVHRNVHLGIHGAVRRSQRADLRARGVLCVLAQRGGGPHPDTDSCYHGRMDHEHLLGNGHGHPGESVLVWLCLFSLFSPVFRFCSLHLSCLCQSCLLLFCLSHTWHIVQYASEHKQENHISTCVNTLQVIFPGYFFIRYLKERSGDNLYLSGFQQIPWQWTDPTSFIYTNYIYHGIPLP